MEVETTLRTLLICVQIGTAFLNLFEKIPLLKRKVKYVCHI